MWKYRKTINCGLLTGVVYIAYMIFFQAGYLASVYNVCDVIFMDYPFQLMFSFLLFSLFHKNNQVSLIIYRFKHIMQYQKKMMFMDIIDLLIFFGIVTSMQIGANIFLASVDNVPIILARNLLLIVIMIFVIYLYHHIYIKNKFNLLICLLLFWNFEMIVLLYFPNTILGIWNIFVLVNHFNLVIFIRWVSVLFVVICIVNYAYNNQSKGVMKWLD